MYFSLLKYHFFTFLHFTNTFNLKRYHFQLFCNLSRIISWHEQDLDHPCHNLCQPCHDLCQLYQDLDQLLSKQTRHREKLRNESSLLIFIDLVESKFMVASLHTLLIMEIRMLLQNYETCQCKTSNLSILLHWNWCWELIFKNFDVK